MATTINNIQPKPITRCGKVYQGVESNTYNAEIQKNKSIRIFGVYRNSTRAPEVTFDKTFRLGATAEYDSYNLKYTGTIVAIGEKTVTVESYGGRHRLDLHTFCWRNWDFDAAKAAEHNANESMYI